MRPLQHLFDRPDLNLLGIDRPDRDTEQRFDRLRRGVYTLRSDESDADSEGRYRRQVLASNRTLTGERVYSHESAAVLHGLPVLGDWPEFVHLIGERRSGGRSQLDVVRHCTGLEDVAPVDVDGLLVTSPARTVFDLAISRPFAAAVVTADAALRLFPDAVHEFAALVSRHGTRRGYLKARRVQSFVDGRSGSVGESCSRVAIHETGFAVPQLQFAVRSGMRTEYTDFAWPEVGGAGEFDGESKYREDRYRRGGTAEDIVIREKNRENRIRQSLPRFARWDWTDLYTPGRLERILLDAGIPKRFAR